MRLPEQYTIDEFKTGMFAFHAFLAQLHSVSPNHIHPRLPVSILVHGYFNLQQILQTLYSQLDFATQESFTAILFGRHDVPSRTFQVMEIWQNDEEVYDAELWARLEHLLAVA